jgi:DNA-binding transcriptional LysR family regulator
MTFIAGAALREGALRAFLAGYKAPPLTLHAVYPPTQYLAVKVRMFIDFLVGRFSGVLPWNAKA